MAQAAPELPTTEQLEIMYASDFDHANITAMRERVSAILRVPQSGLLTMTGPCSLTGESDITERENRDLVDLMQQYASHIALQRRNFWKPRTNPEDWHGPETTEPEETYRRVARAAIAHANGTAEIATMRHLERYGKLLSFGWFGARNTNLAEQIKIAQADPMLPLGVKNALDGDIDTSLATIRTINQERGSDEAPTVLVYRGGYNVLTPESWEAQVRRAHELTEGRMIIDLAHGGEMAHDPAGEGQKSVIGQIACADHALQLASDGIRAAGYLMEASDIQSMTDPNMPHANGIQTIKQLAHIIEN